MKLKIKDREFEITWVEIVVIVVIIYLIVTGNLNELVEFVRSLK